MADKPIIGDDGAVVSKNIQKVEREMTSALNRVLDTVEKRLDTIGQRFAKTISGAVRDSTGGKVGGAGTPMAGGIFKRDGESASGGSLGMGGSMGKTKMATMAVGAAIQGTNMAIDAANARFDRGREGVFEADRMSVLYQQMTGKSQLGVSSTYRTPLTNYRLGAGGINALMGLEAATGISGRQQASSVEAFRTMSGYTMGAGQAAGMINNLASASTVNRMFMMTGNSLVGVGGKQNSAMDVMQGVVKSAGLTDPKILKDALAPGSITRSKLSMMGVPEEMQTQAIQYAMQNQTFQGKGGKGMYDPSKEADRRKMGIEENFATQVEETQRLETERDENFYRRQVDNYASLERQTQTLTKAFGALEDKLSGGLGVFGSNKIATSIFKTVTGFLGDPSGGGDPDGTSMPQNISAAAAQTSFSNLNAQFKDRLTQMMKDNPNVSFGQGVRSSADQRTMFLSRYTKTNSSTSAEGKKNWEWDGSYWEHTSGAPAAPPGRSMHEIGLAADLSGDLDWVVANAHKYGLKHFKDVNGENWHVQPTELPNGRAAYEKMGAPWGRGPAGAAPFDPRSNFGESLDHSTGGSSSSKSTSSSPRSSITSGTIGGSLRAPTISEKVAAKLSPIGTGGSSAPSGRRVISGRVRGASGTEVVTSSNLPFGGQAPSGVNITQWSTDFLNRVGAPVTESNIQAMASWIASEGTRAAFNPLAVITNPDAGALGWTEFNSNGVTNFTSYEQGLEYNVRHMTKYGVGVINALKNKSNNPYDIATSIENAYFQGKGSDKNTLVRQNLTARHIPEPTTSGDPVGTRMSVGGGGGGSVSLSGGHTFNISPNINISSGSGSALDLQKIAHEIAVLTRRELELEMLRSN